MLLGTLPRFVSVNGMHALIPAARFRFQLQAR